MTSYVSHSAAQLRRAQINGAYKSHKSPQLAMKKIALKEIYAHPMVAGQLAKALNISENQLSVILKSLAHDRKIVCIGTAEMAGFTEYRKDTKVWAKFGTPKLAPVKKSVVERKRNPAPGWYRGEFNRAGRSEKEFYGHRDTAMAARGR